MCDACEIDMQHGRVESLDITVFISWFYHENGCKFFVKRMSDNIVRNLVWNTAYIIVKLTIELQEVTTIERSLLIIWGWQVLLNDGRPQSLGEFGL